MQRVDLYSNQVDQHSSLANENACTMKILRGKPISGLHKERAESVGWKTRAERATSMVGIKG